MSVWPLLQSTGLTTHTATTIQRSLKDVGSDLVANLGVLTDFSGHVTQLAGWCGAIRADVVAGSLSSTLPEAQDGADSIMQLKTIRTQWATIKKNTWEYHKAVGIGALHERNVPNEDICRSRVCKHATLIIYLRLAYIGHLRTRPVPSRNLGRLMLRVLSP